MLGCRDLGCQSQGNLEMQEQFTIKPQAPLHISAASRASWGKKRRREHGAPLDELSQLLGACRLGEQEASQRNELRRQEPDKQGTGN